MHRSRTEGGQPAARMLTGSAGIRPNAAIIACAALVALVPHAAHAYLDPGVASFAIQGIVGALAAVAAGVGGYWRSIRGLLKRKRTARRTSDTDRGNGA